MDWKDLLMKKCFEAMYKQGEVRIQFSHRTKSGKLKSVPIVRSYLNNQTICDEVEVVIDD